MKVLSNTLKPYIEYWSDPGGPDRCGGMSALPSRSVVGDVVGTITVEVEADDLLDNEDLKGEVPDEVLVTGWEIVKAEGNTITLAVSDFEER